MYQIPTSFCLYEVLINSFQETRGYVAQVLKCKKIRISLHLYLAIAVVNMPLKRRRV